MLKVFARADYGTGLRGPLVACRPTVRLADVSEPIIASFDLSHQPLILLVQTSKVC
jgi:hypothetical protein